MRHAVVVLALALVACADPASLEMDSAVTVNQAGRVPDLVCPGAQGCADAAGPFRAGVAKRDITPSLDAGPVWIGGFGNGRAATGVHDPQWTRVLSLSRGATRLGIVALDLVGFFHDDVVRIRQAAAALGFDHILVATTHNHEARDTMGMWGASATSSGYDPAYRELIVARTVEALREARDAEKATGVKIATGHAPHLVDDIRLPLVPDQGIHAFAFGGDSVFAVMTVWGNHPEALGQSNKLLTSDFPHYLRESIEARYPGAVAVHLSGILGGLTTPLTIDGCPDEHGKETCPTGTFEKAEYVGRGAAEAAIAALEGSGAQVVAEPALDFRRHSFLLRAENLMLSLGVQAGILPRALHLDDGTRLAPEEATSVDIRDIQSGAARLQTEVNLLRLGAAQILAIPGELYGELWLEREGGGSRVERPAGADFPDAPIDAPLQSRLDAPVKVILNNANDALGYIIPKAQWDVAEPRAYEAEGQYGEVNSMGPETAGVVCEAVRALVALEVK